MISKAIHKTNHKDFTTKFSKEISLIHNKLLSSNKKVLLFLKKLEYSKNISKKKIKRRLEKYLLEKSLKSKNKKFKLEAKKSSLKMLMRKAFKPKSSQIYKT